MDRADDLVRHVQRKHREGQLLRWVLVCHARARPLDADALARAKAEGERVHVAEGKALDEHRPRRAELVRVARAAPVARARVHVGR